MSYELPLAGTNLFAPRADFSGTRPLFWSAAYIANMDFNLCRALVQPAMHLRLEFKPGVAQEAIHALQRNLAFRLESAGLMGGYVDDEQYLVVSLMNAMDETDGDVIVTWLASQPAVATVRFTDVQMLAGVLATLAEREFCEEQPLATARVLSLIRFMNAEWIQLRWEMRHGQTDASVLASVEGGAQ